MRQGQRTVRRVLAILVTVGALLDWGCAQQGEQAAATAEDVNNRSFTFASGAVFHSALTNVSTTLAFTNNATNFTLSSSGGSATGTNVFGSCTLTVTTTAYPAGQGPQVDDVITLNPCDFDSSDDTLSVTHGTITATSASAT